MEARHTSVAFTTSSGVLKPTNATLIPFRFFAVVYEILCNQNRVRGIRVAEGGEEQKEATDSHNKQDIRHCFEIVGNEWSSSFLGRAENAPNPSTKRLRTLKEKRELKELLGEKHKTLQTVKERFRLVTVLRRTERQVFSGRVWKSCRNSEMWPECAK